ncbi:hypothetical protein V8C44DRAFT_338710 [Trichoderma aethiopicum]
MAMVMATTSAYWEGLVRRRLQVPGLGTSPMIYTSFYYISLLYALGISTKIARYVYLALLYTSPFIKYIGAFM